MLNTLVIRSAAFLVLASGGVLYAMEAGWIGDQRTALNAIDEADEVTLTSGSSAAAPFSMTPDLPEIVTGSGVSLTLNEDSLATDAMIVPASFDFGTDAPFVAAPPEFSDFGLSCDVAVSANPMPAAMVAVDVMAPCRANAPVQILHAGLVLEAETDALGLLTVDIPGFSSPAHVTVIFEDGVEQTASTELSDLTDFDRVGLTWHGDLGLELHAMEAGAEFGGEGHIWRGTPSSAEIAFTEGGGFLTEMALNGTTVQVYTLPRAFLHEGNAVQMSIDAPITSENCASTALARTLRSEGGQAVDVTELSFTVPGCDAVGDVLVLQNVLADMRIASN